MPRLAPSPLGSALQGFRTVAYLAAFMLLAACNLSTPRDGTPSPSTTASVSEPPPTATTTAATRPRAILVTTPDADPVVAARLKDTMGELTAAAQLELQVLSALSAAELSAGPRVVVAAGKDALVGTDPASYPQTQFVAVAIPDLQPGPNLSLIGAKGVIPDQLGFLGGYVAALITPDYRVAVVSADDSPAHSAASLGFVNGAVFYCGLCLPTVPPFKPYPLAFPVATDTATFQADGVQTVYVVGDDAQELERLAGMGLSLIGETTPPTSVRERWVATVAADPAPALRELWPDLLKGQGGKNLPLYPSLLDAKPGAISPGRLRLIDEASAGLASGLIDTAVDPSTGLPR